MAYISDNVRYSDEPDKVGRFFYLPVSKKNQKYISIPHVIAAIQTFSDENSDAQVSEVVSFAARFVKNKPSNISLLAKGIAQIWTKGDNKILTAQFWDKLIVEHLQQNLYMTFEPSLEGPLQFETLWYWEKDKQLLQDKNFLLDLESFDDTAYEVELYTRRLFPDHWRQWKNPGHPGLPVLDCLLYTHMAPKDVFLQMPLAYSQNDEAYLLAITDDGQAHVFQIIRDNVQYFQTLHIKLQQFERCLSVCWSKGFFKPGAETDIAIVGTNLGNLYIFYLTVNNTFDALNDMPKQLENLTKITGIEAELQTQTAVTKLVCYSQDYEQVGICTISQNGITFEKLTESQKSNCVVDANLFKAKFNNNVGSTPLYQTNEYGDFNSEALRKNFVEALHDADKSDADKAENKVHTLLTLVFESVEKAIFRLCVLYQNDFSLETRVSEVTETIGNLQITERTDGSNDRNNGNAREEQKREAAKAEFNSLRSNFEKILKIALRQKACAKVAQAFENFVETLEEKATAVADAGSRVGKLGREREVRKQVETMLKILNEVESRMAEFFGVRAMREPSATKALRLVRARLQDVLVNAQGHVATFSGPTPSEVASRAHDRMRWFRELWRSQHADLFARAQTVSPRDAGSVQVDALRSLYANLRSTSRAVREEALQKMDDLTRRKTTKKSRHLRDTVYKKYISLYDARDAYASTLGKIMRRAVYENETPNEASNLFELAYLGAIGRKGDESRAYEDALERMQTYGDLGLSSPKALERHRAETDLYAVDRARSKTRNGREITQQLRDELLLHMRDVQQKTKQQEIDTESEIELIEKRRMELYDRAYLYWGSAVDELELKGRVTDFDQNKYEIMQNKLKAQISTINGYIKKLQNISPDNEDLQERKEETVADFNQALTMYKQKLDDVESLPRENKIQEQREQNVERQGQTLELANKMIAAHSRYKAETTKANAKEAQEAENALIQNLKPPVRFYETEEYPSELEKQVERAVEDANNIINQAGQSTEQITNNRDSAMETETILDLTNQAERIAVEQMMEQTGQIRYAGARLPEREGAEPNNLYNALQIVQQEIIERQGNELQEALGEPNYLQNAKQRVQERIDRIKRQKKEFQEAVDNIKNLLGRIRQDDLRKQLQDRKTEIENIFQTASTRLKEAEEEVEILDLAIEKRQQFQEEAVAALKIAEDKLKNKQQEMATQEANFNQALETHKNKIIQQEAEMDQMKLDLAEERGNITGLTQEIEKNMELIQTKNEEIKECRVQLDYSDELQQAYKDDNETLRDAKNECHSELEDCKKQFALFTSETSQTRKRIRTRGADAAEGS